MQSALQLPRFLLPPLVCHFELCLCVSLPQPTDVLKFLFL